MPKHHEPTTSLLHSNHITICYGDCKDTSCVRQCSIINQTVYITLSRKRQTNGQSAFSWISLFITLISILLTLISIALTIVQLQETCGTCEQYCVVIINLVEILINWIRPLANL